jgi:branched-chain amino acid transport system permease protein
MATVERVAEQPTAVRPSTSAVAWPTIGMAAAWAGVAMVFLLAPMFLGNYHMFVAQKLVILAVMALGLNLFQGYCGQAHFGISGFAIIGAYASGLIETKLDVHPLLTLAPALLLGGVVAYLVSFVVLRLRHMSQALVTVAFALTLYSLLLSALPRTWGGGDEGLSLPPIELFNARFTYTSTYYLLLILLVVVLIVCALVVRSAVGRAWTAIRGDEVAAGASGVDVTRFMRSAFVLTGVVATLGGAMMAMQSRYIAPSDFDLFSNIFILLVVVIGGQGSNAGMILGAVVLTVIGEFVADLQDFPTFVYGFILFAVMRFLPRGLWPHLRDGVRSLAAAVARRRTPRADPLDATPAEVS